MFWLPGVVVAVIAISIAALLLLARSTCPEEWERISELLWLIWCWIYTIRWRMRFAWRTATGQTAGGFLFFASLYVVLELTLAVVSALTEEAGGPPVRIPYIPHVPRIARLPLWAELVVILVAILVLRHHWREWNIKVRESHVPESLHNLITQCRRYLRKPDLNSNDTDELLRFVIGAIESLLKIGRKKHVLVFCIVRPNNAMDALNVVFVHPPNTPKIGFRRDL